MGVLLSKDLSSIDIDSSWNVPISGSSTAQSCSGAGILWGVDGISKEDCSM